MIAEEGGRATGFSKGIVADHPDYDAELSKIYLEWSHHRRGIGRRLLAESAQRMLARGLRSMVLFADPGNPHIAFYERMHGERLTEQGGDCSAAFGWPDLSVLVESRGDT